MVHSDINPSVDYHGDVARALMIQSPQITTAPSNQYSSLWTVLIQTTCRNFRKDRREAKRRRNRQRLERCWLTLKISMMWPYVIKYWHLPKLPLLWKKAKNGLFFGAPREITALPIHRLKHMKLVSTFWPSWLWKNFFETRSHVA